MTVERGALVGAMVLASFAGGTASSAWISASLNAQATSPVTTEQVNIVNRAGRLRAILSSEDETGLASLALLDESGRRRLVVAADQTGSPMMQLYDETQVLRLLVGIQNNQPVVVVRDAKDQRALLGTVTGSPALVFADGQRTRAEIGISGGGLPGLQMVGPTGQIQLSLVVADPGQPLMTLRDANGRTRASIGVVQDATVVNLADGSNARIVLGVAADGNPSLAFRDETGAVIHRVP